MNYVPCPVHVLFVIKTMMYALSLVNIMASGPAEWSGVVKHMMLQIRGTLTFGWCIQHTAHSAQQAIILKMRRTQWHKNDHQIIQIYYIIIRFGCERARACVVRFWILASKSRRWKVKWWRMRNLKVKCFKHSIWSYTLCALFNDADSMDGGQWICQCMTMTFFLFFSLLLHRNWPN